MNRNNTIRALELLESHPEGQKNTISLPILSMKVAYQNRLLVDEITKWQSSMLPAPQTTDLSNNLDAKLDAASEVLDLRIFPSEVSIMLISSISDCSIALRCCRDPSLCFVILKC